MTIGIYTRPASMSADQYDDISLAAGDRWLQHARQFAMHALWQVERSRELFSQGRHSLWTGDIGVAMFLNECLRESARFPTIDVF